MLLLAIYYRKTKYKKFQVNTLREKNNKKTANYIAVQIYGQDITTH